MYDQIREDILFIILYSVVTAMAMMASCYLLFRQGNAFAKDVTPPVRLRRWTAAFFAALVLNHVVYMPIFFLSSSEDIMTIDLIGGFLDCMALFPVAIIVLFAMLQDHRRPLWPVAAMFVPLIVGGAFGVAVRSYVLLPVVYVYFLLMCIGLIIYMVRALRQYGRWLRDNSTLAALPAKNIGVLLQQHCIDTQLYLQHDLNLSQLAKAVGTNRFYLSQYFSSQDSTYNAYINNLRVNHFVSVYREAVAAHRSFTVMQLAQESGFRSYNTFSSAFKRKTGQSVTAWIKAHEGQE